MNAAVAAIVIVALAGQPASGPVGPAPAPAPTATPAPAPTATPSPTPTPSDPAQDRHPVRSSSGWDDTAAAPAPVVVVTPAAAPATDVPPPQKKPKDRVGSALLASGGAVMGLGAASLVFIAMPCAISKRVSLDRASRDPVWDVGTRKDRYRRARRADDAMEAGFWIGITGVTVGLALIIAGAVSKSRFKRRLAEGQVAGTPGGLAVRF